MAGAPYQVDCRFTDDETPFFAGELIASDGSVLDTDGLTFEYVVNRSGGRVFEAAVGSGLTLEDGVLTFTIPAGTLGVGRYTHGCRFTRANGTTSQLFDGGIVVTQGEF
jgi:hypothetical protein